MKLTHLCAMVLAIASGAALAANKIEGVTVAPATIKAGSSVTITVTGDETQGNNCGFRINYGDGDGFDVKVVNRDQFPRTFTKTYARPGTYTISAAGKKVTSHFPCTGGAKTTLVVEAAPAAATTTAPAIAPPPVAAPGAAPAAKAAAPSCPVGYQASYAAKDGSFQCRQIPDAPTRATRTSCPDGYLVGPTAKDGSFTCRLPAPKPAPKPVAKMQCPPGLIYFENPDGAFGCRKPTGQ